MLSPEILFDFFKNNKSSHTLDIETVVVASLKGSLNWKEESQDY